MDIQILVADYQNLQHQQDIGLLLDTYARDPMGANAALDKGIRQSVAVELSKVPGAFSVLCYVDQQAAGLANCLQGFSTFKCKPLINIHDLAVMQEFRGLGLSQKMLNKVEELARQRQCCKITLEVLEGNKVAQQAYLKFGFSGYELDPETGKALFWEKVI